MKLRVRRIAVYRRISRSISRRPRRFGRARPCRRTEPAMIDRTAAMGAMKKRLTLQASAGRFDTLNEITSPICSHWNDPDRFMFFSPFAWLRRRRRRFARRAPRQAHPHPERPEHTIWEMFEEKRPKLVAYCGRFDEFHALPASVSKTCSASKCTQLAQAQLRWFVSTTINARSTPPQSQQAGRDLSLCQTDRDPSRGLCRWRKSPLLRARRADLRPWRYAPILACNPAPSRSLRSIATRWDKFTKNYLAALKLVAVRIWLRSNEFTIQGLSMHQRRIVSLTLCFWLWVAKAELSTARLIRSNRLITFLEASVTTRRAALY